MRINLSHCQLARARATERIFEAVREQEVVIWPAQTGTRAVAHSLVSCQGALRPGEACLHCSHFLNAVPAAGGGTATVRCLFLETAPIEDLMTTTTNLVIVDESVTTRAAIGAARARAQTAVVVSANREAVGILSLRSLIGGRPNEPVGARLAGPAGLVARTSQLAAVAAAMRECGFDALLVADQDELVGAVTRDDLRRAGVRTPYL